MDPIEVAAEAMKRIQTEVQGYQSTITSEQDTRLKVINRILTEVLGWPLTSILTEEQSGDGFLDYKLSVDDAARLIVEAKKDGRSLGIANRSGGQTFKLSGVAFQEPSAREGIAQAVSYCGRKNAELACVTNGREWIVFRGSRLGDGKDTMDGQAFVFPSLDALLEKFALFYDLLAYPAVATFSYQSHFAQAEGKPPRKELFRKALRPPSTQNLMQRDKLSKDIDRVMTSFFRRLTNDTDEEMIRVCFAVTNESRQADENLARISEDLVGRIRTLDTANADALTELIRRAHQMHRNEFVIIVGTKGAGKTTFIDRFFQLVLPKDVAKDCVLIRVNMALSDGNPTKVIQWLDRNLLEAVEQAIFPAGPPTFDELQGMFFDEYKRWMVGPKKFLYEASKDQFKIEFGKHVEDRREQQPLGYICRLVGSIVRLRKKIPCLVFDNADHFDIPFQEAVFQYARSIYEKELCLIIVPITDKTSWALSQQGALQTYEDESLFLPVPPVADVMAKRISYVAEKAGKEKGENYFFGRGITLSLSNLTAFADCLRKVFLGNERTTDWISNLSNQDLRRALELAEFVMTSPHLRVESHITGYLAKQEPKITETQIKRALICGKHDIYPLGQHKFIQNVYALQPDVETTPLLCLRILQMLAQLHTDPRDGSRVFTPIEDIYQYFAAIGISAMVMSSWLDGMLKAGLCLSYDPMVTDITKVSKIELAPAGYQHLIFGSSDPLYAYCMSQVTPILDGASFEKLSDYTAKGRSAFAPQAVGIFANHLIEEDALYCKIPSNSAYRSQERLGLTVARLSAVTAYDVNPCPVTIPTN